MSLLARSLIKKDFNIPVSRGTSYQLINGRLVAYTDNQKNYLEKGYSVNDIVYSIVNLIMDKCRVAPWGIYTIVDEQAYKSFQAIQRKKDWSAKDFVEAAKFQHKALKPAGNPGKWGELVKYPNQYDTFNDFIANGIGYDCLLGNNYTWGSPLTDGANKGVPNELWLLPAQHTNIFSTDSFPTRIEKYNVNLWPTVEYKPEEILHEKTWNPNWDVNGTQLYGISPLKASLARIQNANSSVNTQTASFENEGVKGVLHMKGVPGQVDGEILVQEVERLKETMISEWSGTEQRGRIGLGGYDMGWIPIGLSAEEMQVIDSQKWSLRMLCNPFGVPSQLLNDDQKAYNNFEEAEKSLTCRAALPRLTRKRNALTRKAITNWGLPKNNCIDFDMSVFSELQADVKDTAEWTAKLIAISPNEQRELCGLAALPDETMNEPWINPSGRQAKSEYDMTSVDNALNDGEANL